MRILSVIFFCLMLNAVTAQQSRFERSGGSETATYAEVIDWYRELDRRSPLLQLKSMGPTDAGYPLHLVLLSAGRQFDPVQWRKNRKAVILINNGIHPGEPDGIDASMMLARDIVTGKLKLPSEVVVAIVPLYNIGGALVRSKTSRANQQGPVEYGFRGNARNLDLNRDFTKCDSREARSFSSVFHWLQPDILVDNHVSDGADYQHTFTLLTSQYDKLGTLGEWVRTSLEPALYRGMAAKGHSVAPYVNFEMADLQESMEMFYDPPRFSSGYAALFQTIGLVPETHMLKPFAARVQSTYDFMQTLIATTAVMKDSLLSRRAAARAAVQQQARFPLSWAVDSTRWSPIRFSGYETGIRKSRVTGMDTRYFDHEKPFTRDIRYYHFFLPKHEVQRPAAYLVPQAWDEVLHRLRLNKVLMRRLTRDTVMKVEVTRIDDYRSVTRPYEGHYKHYGVQTSVRTDSIRFLKGDYLISLQQPACRYIVEMLEPTGDDSFFAWNFFDAILQQKEGYSTHRWEEVAEGWLKQNPGLRDQLEAKKQSDSSFASNAAAQLDFVYRRSPWYEPVHLRYPVFRVPE